jgi:rubrerythrin
MPLSVFESGPNLFILYIIISYEVDMEKNEVLKVLKESSAMEERGYKFYMEGVKKIKNSLGKRMLSRLAEDELLHLKRINEIYEQLTNNKAGQIKIPSAKVENFDKIFSRMRENLDDAVDELTEVGVNDEEIINVALELEAHSKFYYKEASEKASDQKVKEFYHRLAEEETNHYELLRKTNKYLENPALFFGMGYH